MPPIDQLKPQRELYLPFTVVEFLRKKNSKDKKEIFELFRDGMCCKGSKDPIVIGVIGNDDMSDMFKIKTIEELKTILKVEENESRR